MTIVVRIATAADLDTLAQLNQVVQKVHAELYPDDFRTTVDAEGLKALLTPRLANVIIAEVDDKPVGYIWFEMQRGPRAPFRPRASGSIFTTSRYHRMPRGAAWPAP
jgi:hypothetical protein